MEVDRKWILVTSQVPAFTFRRCTSTVNAPGPCGWRSGRGSFSDDYFVPARNAAREK